MKIAVLVARILLGLAFFASGLSFYIHLMPQQLPPGDAGTLMSMMFKHGWFSFYGLFYVVGGLLILIGRFVSIGLVLLGPILVNILLYHVTFNLSGIWPGLVLTVLEIFLIYAYREHFKALFTPGWIR